MNIHQSLSDKQIEIFSRVPELSEEPKRILIILATYWDKKASFDAVVTLPQTIRSMQQTTKVLEDTKDRILQSQIKSFFKIALVVAIVSGIILLSPPLLILLPLLFIPGVFSGYFLSSSLKDLIWEFQEQEKLEEQKKILQKNSKIFELKCCNEHAKELLNLVNRELEEENCSRRIQQELAKRELLTVIDFLDNAIRKAESSESQ